MLRLTKQELQAEAICGTEQGWWTITFVIAVLRPGMQSK